MRRGVLPALLLSPVAAAGGWPPFGSNWHRAFWPTADGQLHYVTAGQEQAPHCLLLLSENPRSADEFTELMGELCGGEFYCVALDFFGNGHSDDVRSSPDRAPPFSARGDERSYTRYAAGLLRHLGRTECVPVGAKTGATLALVLADELPHLSTDPVVVPRVAYSNFFYYFPDVAEKVAETVDRNHHWIPPVDGSHLAQAWEGAGTWAQGDTVLQQRRAVDAVRAVQPQWAVQKANLDANVDGVLDRVRGLHTPQLWFFGTHTATFWDARGFRFTEGAALLTSAARRSEAHYITGGGDSMLSQNTTFIASTLRRFITHKVP